ncbi:hypothetical protein A8F94_17455 [Bacillus sp. FJAT-27225]|uniref:phage tail domain-containing protein n=1 Tax=Bacillus sp. FJAT-27225 TaxID=1743144 RepID=UPI00080C34D5|nr:phage tail domain-containing protein [Bacillus sp. FJAT-27225]OCA84483.1 hypothetical protein A8F94_17455 [Bacillus sp. FJAT-27225]
MFVVYDEQMIKKEFPPGARPLDIFISSIISKRIRNEVEGKHGYVDKGRLFSTRDIEVSIGMKAYDAKDYRFLRDNIYSFFSENEFMYISELHQSGKRYKVSMVEWFLPERLTKRAATARFGLELFELPFAESIGKTADIQRDGIDSNKELWGPGMGLISDDDSLVYTHTANQFRIYNAGDVPIHPFEQDLKITISEVQGSTSFLELKNDTNGSVFRVNETVNSSQVIVIDGPNITSNSLQFLRKTNRKFIELAPGWNDFTVTGATSAKVDFDFRFYYL